MADTRLIAMLEMLLRESTVDGERESARLAANRLLNGKGLKQALEGEDSDPARVVQLVASLRAENERLREELRKALEQQSGLIRDTIDVWVQEGGKAPLPPARNGRYPFAVLKVVCVNRIGQKGWQAACAKAIEIETGKPFRTSVLLDWRRSRQGVPAEMVILAARTAHLKRPVPHTWTHNQRMLVRARIEEGADDTAIMQELGTMGVNVTTESVRAIRKQLKRVAGRAATADGSLVL